MDDKLPDEILRRIQETVAAETGVHLAPEAASRLYASLLAAPGGHASPPREGLSQEVTVLLADLRGFTAISEANPARTVLEALNRFLGRMCEIAVCNGGTIDKFMGDAVMVLFGAPFCRDDDARRAVACAVQMQIAMDAINRENAAGGLPPLYMGAGINTGRVMVGTLGSKLYSEYTVIGDEVNIASRIEAFSLRGQVLISETTFERCEGFVVAGEPMDVHVKGKSKPVRLREVLAIPSLDVQVPRQDVRKSPRVETRIPFTYRSVVDKIVVPPARSGVVLDLSYEGMLALVEPGLAKHADIHVELDLSPMGSRTHQIYAMVRNVRLDDDRQHFAGIEFTSVSSESEKDLRYLVQLLIQGSPLK
jgi:adenylate cyclase